MALLENLVEELHRKVGNQKGLVKELKEVLDISQDSIYRRLRGDSEFTLDEVAKLAAHYGFSVDALIFKDAPATVFKFNTLYENREAFPRYLTHIADQMHALRKANGSLTFIASELPISQSFLHETLRDFKIFYWQRVILNQSWMRDVHFSEHFNPGIEAIQNLDSLMKSYSSIKKVEMWTEETLDDTVRQILYSRDCGLFASNNDFQRVCESLINCLNRLEKELETPPDDDSGLSFYVSSVELGNNIVLMDFGDYRNVYLKFNTFNTVMTSNDLFCDEIEQMVKVNLQKCVEISGKSDIYRHRFFNKLRGKVEALLVPERV